jgi:hypothetical protein
MDVHSGLTCAACHLTDPGTDYADSVAKDTRGGKKNQCDPGRGFDMLSNTQDGVPPLVQRAVMDHYSSNWQAVASTDVAASIRKHDTRNTVKRCEFCHITGKDYAGNTINTYGAPNPASSHAQYGLTANIVQMVDKYEISGTGFGSQGIPSFTNFTTQKTFNAGNHLDIIDCSVCHVQDKKTMACRSLDATSGIRYPVVIGTDKSKGLMGMFLDPTNGQMPGMGGPLAGWKPLHMWQKLGNMDLPLTTNLTAGIKTGQGSSQMQFRRKLTLGNAITAAFWNNTDTTVDANGDGIPGGLLIGDAPDGTATADTKPSLHGYTDIFTGLPPTLNDTAGYGDPIFDAYTMRNLKAGMTFAPGSFGPIPVGFGSDSRYMTGYDATFGFTGAYKFVGIWGGPVILTEPDQIRDYKAFRETIKQTNEPSWSKAQLSYYAVPFMVTHGVKPVSQFAKGTSCADCHAPTAGFFSGDYDMVGPAIPADRTYNPARQLTGLDSSGDPIYTNNSGGSATTMMQRPLEDIPRIKAYKDDLFTGLEIVNKLGQPRTIRFEAEDATHTYKWTVPVQLGDVLYPDTNAAYKDIKGVTHSGSAAWIAYLTSVDTTLADYGIGVNPVAKLQSPIADADSTQTGIQVATGTALSVKAELAQPNAGKTADIGTVTYAWTTNDSAAVITNPSSRTAATFTFSTTGTKTITLTVTDEEGKVSSTYVTVYAVVPPITIAWADNTGNLGGTINVSNLLPTTNYVKIYFGDGAYVTKTITVGNTTTSQIRTYATAGSKLIQVYAYNSAQKQISYMQQSITVNGAN